MDLFMSDTPLDRLPAFNRVSIRGVLVHEGEDPRPALAAAGIVNPIAIPVVLGEDLDLSGGILGNGITPNLKAVLETEQHDDFDSSPTNQPNEAGSQPSAARSAEPVTTTLPAAYGQPSFASNGRLGDPRSGRFGYPPTVCPPSPGWSSQVDAIVNAGCRKLYASAGNGPISNVNPGGLTTEANPNSASDDTTNQGAVKQRPNGQSAPDPNSPTGNVMSSVADPIGAAGRKNLYASAGTEPLNNVDPSAGCEFMNQDQSAQPGKESGLCDESIGGLEAGIGTVAAIDAANQELTAMVDGLGQDSRAGTQFTGPGAPRTIGPNNYAPAPGGTLPQYGPPSPTQTLRGGASFYRPTGNPTARGQPYDPNAMTAAMLHVPFGTVVTVTLTSNPGSSIVVTVTDRGPYAAGRVIDLTPAAFIALVGSIAAGVVQVVVSVP